VADKVGRQISRPTLRTILRAAGLRWKQCKKLLSKGDAQKRAHFVEHFQTLYDRMCCGDVILVYVDEVHLHQDLEVGYTWSAVGEANWVSSTSPGRSARLNYFGAYNFTAGTCLLWEDGYCNGETTLRFLEQVAQWLGATDRQVVLIWDGASYHRSPSVRCAAEQLGFQLLPLPGYSPDLNPIEALWRWLRKEVTQHYCHHSLAELHQACLAFIRSINLQPELLITRLWPLFELDPELEKLRFSP
jgi:transposase